MIVSEVIICTGPPECPFSDDEAVQNQNDGCPNCKRILIDENGNETVYRKKAN